MATARCFKCQYNDTEITCPVCELLVEIDDGVAILGDSPETLEITVKVREPLYGEEYEFVASVEDDGIMFATPFDWHDVDGDCEERNEDAWAALDCRLGFDVRGSALESGIGASAPFGSSYPAVSFAVLPFHLGERLVDKMRSDGREIVELLECLKEAEEVSEDTESF